MEAALTALSQKFKEGKRIKVWYQVDSGPVLELVPHRLRVEVLSQYSRWSKISGTYVCYSQVQERLKELQLRENCHHTNNTTDLISPRVTLCDDLACRRNRLWYHVHLIDNNLMLMINSDTRHWVTSVAECETPRRELPCAMIGIIGDL